MWFIAKSQEPSSICCTTSSLQLRQKDLAFYPTSSKPLLEDAASNNLRRPIEIPKDKLQSLPMTLLWNLSNSFMSLVDSRLRSSMGALLQHHLLKGKEPDSLTWVLVGLLSGSSADSTSPIKPTTIVTTFRPLKLSERNSDGDYILPLILKLVIDVNIFGTILAVAVEAPGTVQGSFAGNTEQLHNIDVQIDTTALLATMMTQARVVIRKAIHLATQKAFIMLRLVRAVSSSNLASSSNTGSTCSSLHYGGPRVGMGERLRQAVQEVNLKRVAATLLGPASYPGHCFLMPPPPTHESSNSLSEGDAKIFSRSSLGNDDTRSQNTHSNHSWSELKQTKNTGFSGLALLTWADEHMRKSKKRRISRAGNSHGSLTQIAQV
jgi:hypothetical protein